jgi:hypothetical protein
MATLDWEKANRNDKVRHYPPVDAFESTPSGRQGKKPVFQAKRSGVCATCRRPFLIGDRIKVNVNGDIVHGRGCPKKSIRSLQVADEC